MPEEKIVRKEKEKKKREIDMVNLKKTSHLVTIQEITTDA